MKETEKPPKARQVAGSQSMIELPVFDYHKHFDAAADRRYFIDKHGNSASDEELEAEMIEQAKKLRAKGMRWKPLDRYFGVSRNRIRYLLDEDFRRREIERICTHQSKARAA